MQDFNQELLALLGSTVQAANCESRGPTSCMSRKAQFFLFDYSAKALLRTTVQDKHLLVSADAPRQQVV